MTTLSDQVKQLEEQLDLETRWAEGEIDFWKGECEAGDLLIQLLTEEIEELKRKQSKPWWRYIIS